MNQSAEHVLARLVDVEKEGTSGIESRRKYLHMHERRFVEILQLCRALVSDLSARVLDVGRSELTAHLSTFYRDVHTLGLDPHIDDGGHRETRELTNPHITFDLLRTPAVADWPECGKFDLVVFSEVIEHLHVAPAYVLAFLGSLLAAGGLLVCTTPNATGIGKRIRMLTGRNPYEQLRLYSLNPGHIREYTKQELVEIAQAVGLDCRRHSYNVWIVRKKQSPLASLKGAVMRLLYAYPAFRPFQIFVFGRKEDASSSL